jgi:hypothetical protein
VGGGEGGRGSRSRRGRRREWEEKREEEEKEEQKRRRIIGFFSSGTREFFFVLLLWDSAIFFRFFSFSFSFFFSSFFFLSPSLDDWVDAGIRISIVERSQTDGKEKEEEGEEEEKGGGERERGGGERERGGEERERGVTGKPKRSPALSLSFGFSFFSPLISLPLSISRQDKKEKGEKERRSSYLIFPRKVSATDKGEESFKIRMLQWRRLQTSNLFDLVPQI